MYGLSLSHCPSLSFESKGLATVLSNIRTSEWETMTASYRGTGWVWEITRSSLRLQTNYRALHRHLDNTPQIYKGALGNLNRLEWINLTNTSMNGSLRLELGRLSHLFGHFWRKILFQGPFQQVLGQWRNFNNYICTKTKSMAVFVQS